MTNVDSYENNHGQFSIAAHLYQQHAKESSMRTNRPVNDNSDHEYRDTYKAHGQQFWPLEHS